MRAIKKMIPLWIKATISVFITEIGRWPINIVLVHMWRSFAQNGGCGEKGKRRAERAVQKATYAWLKKQYGHLAADISNDYSVGEPVQNAPIWVFWWQGEESAPDIVKRCIASFRRNAFGKPICVIDATNYSDYVSVPPHIIKKMEAGIISLTHFSDYFRMALLAAHGGIWIDASLYLKGALPEGYENMPIYTVRNPGGDATNISNWEWTVGVISGWKGNTLFSTTEKLLSTYWETNDRIIDYFLFDYMIRVVVDHCNDLFRDISAIPANNSSFMYLQNHLCEAADIYMDHFYSQDTVLYKISWKMDYPRITPGGKETMYSRWLTDNPDK